MGNALSHIEDLAADIRTLDAQRKAKRFTMQSFLRSASERGHSLSELAKASGLTREGVRYLIGRQHA